MVGVDNRTTMDIDTTVTGIDFSEEKLIEMFEEICVIDADDDMTFHIDYITEIREGDEYPGFRIALKANYEKMSVPLSIDVTTGDKITPAAVETEIPTMFDEGTIKIPSYNLETIFAEKMETILSRAEANTRPRDYYDVYILHALWKNKCDHKVLKLALERTTAKRGTSFILNEIDSILDKISNSSLLKNNWGKYCKKSYYAKDITFEQTCTAMKEIMEELRNV